MGPRTLCGLFLCHLIWLSCGSPVEVVEGNAPTDGPEDLSFLQAEYRQIRDSLCNKKWTPWGFYCYRYFETPRSFSDAEDECQSYSRNGHLVSVSTMENSNFLARLVQNSVYNVWIGLTTAQGCKAWRWSDGTTYNEQFTFWADEQPHLCNTSKQACVQLTQDSRFFKWKDADCGLTSGYICEVPTSSP
ncbi:snaclec alboaggregin-A subunit alpha'-like [Sphaerodactylus townsendi]|uniref:Uncharacterized protein n=1 Tax=Sphaerodactylus townsendi TaxID=933632 RepID=A0ACB8FLX0_9SAUR|nr:snaclec alboaggregin-A subunit alpha'-like [Sphaerodactylus townsendi]